MPATGSSVAILRTASSSCLPESPPGSGVPVPGAIPGSTTSTSTERNTPSHSSVAISNASDRHSSSPRETISLISNERIRCSAIQASVAGSGQYPRSPICRNRSPRTAPDSISRRIGVPCPYSEPNWISPVSACASKWISDARPHEHVAGVADAQFGQRVHAQREVRPGPVVRQVVGDPDRLRAEPGARPVRGPAVERRAEDHHVAGVERVEFHPGHPEERDVRPEHPAQYHLIVIRHGAPFGQPDLALAPYRGESQARSVA